MKSEACCPWIGRTGFLLGMVLAAGLGFGGYLVGRSTQSTEPVFQFPALPLDATATDSGDEFAIATGTVSEDAEGLFLLDYATGLLQCHVLYTRGTPQIGAVFQANIKEILPGDAGKGGSKYLMVTGRAEFPGNNQNAGSTVCYVLDTVTGSYAVFGVPFQRTAVNAGQAQMRPLVFITKGEARGLPDRNRR